MATNSEIIKENLEEALYRIEFRVPYKIFKFPLRGWEW